MGAVSPKANRFPPLVASDRTVHEHRALEWSATMISTTLRRNGVGPLFSRHWDRCDSSRGECTNADHLHSPKWNADKSQSEPVPPPLAGAERPELRRLSSTLRSEHTTHVLQE